MALINFSWVLPDKLAGVAKPGQPLCDENSVRADIEERAHLGGKCLVSLEKPHDNIRAICEACSITWKYFPVPDFCVPENVDAFKVLINEIVALIQSGTSVCVNCYAGVGRTGLVLSCVIGALFDIDADSAIAAVRRSRSAVETVAQEEFVHEILDSVDDE